MKPISYLFLITAIMSAFGCNTSREILQPESRTDYVAGQSYQLKKPVFLFKYNKSDLKEIPRLEKLGFSGTPSNLQEFMQRSLQNSQVAGLLLPGDQIQVMKFVENRAPNIGTFLSIIGIVTSGENKGTTVEMNMISKEGRPSYRVFMDSEYMIPVK